MLLLLLLRQIQIELGWKVLTVATVMVVSGKWPSIHTSMSVCVPQWLRVSLMCWLQFWECIKPPAHGSVRRPVWWEGFTAGPVTTVCGFPLISQNRGFYGRQGVVSSAGVYQRETVPSFMGLFLASSAGCWRPGTGSHWKRLQQLTLTLTPSQNTWPSVRPSATVWGCQSQSTWTHWTQTPIFNEVVMLCKP